MVYPGLAVVVKLGSDGVRIYWLLLFMVLHLPLTIWLFLVSTVLGVSVWSLSPVSLGCFRSYRRHMVLAVADLRCLQIVGSVALAVAHFPGDLQTVGSSGEHSC